MLERYGPKGENETIFDTLNTHQHTSIETVETVCVPQKKQRSTQT